MASIRLHGRTDRRRNTIARPSVLDKEGLICCLNPPSVTVGRGDDSGPTTTDISRFNISSIPGDFPEVENTLPLLILGNTGSVDQGSVHTGDPSLKFTVWSNNFRVNVSSSVGPASGVVRTVATGIIGLITTGRTPVMVDALR